MPKSIPSQEFRNFKVQIRWKRQLQSTKRLMENNNMNEENTGLILHLRAGTEKLLRNRVLSTLPRYHRDPNKDYLPYIHRKLTLEMKSKNPARASIETLFDEYKKMEDGIVKRELLDSIVIRLCRLIDSRRISGNEPLTLKRIPSLLKVDSVERNEVERQIREIETKLVDIEEYRHKSCAHIDLDDQCFQDKTDIYITMWGAYSWVGDKPPREDTVALAFGNRYTKLNSHRDLLHRYNSNGVFDDDIRRIEDAIKELKEYYDPVTCNRVERKGIGNTYDEINDTISEAIDMISCLLDFVGNLCQERFEEVFTPVQLKPDDAQTTYSS